MTKYKIDFKQEVRIQLYSLDFLIGNIDLEIDGDQHYKVERIRKSDERRTKFLEDNGFSVKRIRWGWYEKLSMEERKKFIKQLILFLKSNGKDSPFPFIKEKNKIIRTKKERCPICGKNIPLNYKTFCSCECQYKHLGRNIPSKEELLKKIEDIGFNKVQLGKFYGVSDNSVNKWLVKYGIPKSHKDFKIWLELR